MKEREMEPNRFDEEMSIRSTGTGNDIAVGVS